jgi:streptomycin 6-kinase
MTPDVVVPPELVASMTAIHGPRGARWCADLPRFVGDLAARWGIELGQPFPATFHWVAAGMRGRSDVVLKVGIPNAEGDLAREAGILTSWAGSGAVRLFDAELAGPDVAALLLERVRPGTDLTELADEVAMPLIGATARALHDSGTARPSAALDPEALADLRTGHPALPAALTTRAADQLAALLADSADRVLCHGDLHHGNVLLGADGPVAIDPRGVWAEPALDVSVAMLNPMGTLPGGRTDLARLLERRLELLCPAMGVSVERGRAWTGVYAVVSAFWTAEDGMGVDEGSLAVAEILS